MTVVKKRVGILIVGNFYTYTVYEIKDAKGGVFYIAEPRGIGATRSASTVDELHKILTADVPMLNLISRQR